MDNFGTRLREERSRLGLSQEAFGAIGGVKKGAQFNYEANERAPDSHYLSSIAEHGVDVLYVLTGRRGSSSSIEAQLARMRDQLARPDDFAPIPVHEASVGAGPGRTNTNEEVVGHLAFRRDWLKRIGVAPASAAVARVEGESMVPTIHPGDVVLVDTAQNAPPSRMRGPKDARPAPIYALVDGGGARVKRLELVAPSTVALLSDNPASPPEVRPLDALSIIGRVLWWGHTNRE